MVRTTVGVDLDIRPFRNPPTTEQLQFPLLSEWKFAYVFPSMTPPFLVLPLGR